MKKKMKIDQITLMKIMKKRAKFQMEANKAILRFMRLISLILIVLIIILTMVIGVDILLLTIGFLLVFVNILLLNSIQSLLTEKAYKRLARKKSIDYILVDLEITDNDIYAKSTIGDQVIESHFDFKNLYRTYYDSQAEVIIFSQKKYVTNFAKSRPRYIYIKDFPETDKLAILDLFKKNSVVFYSDKQKHKSIRHKPLSKRKKTLTRIFYLLIIAGIILVSFLGWFDDTYPLEPNNITDDYSQYTTAQSDSSFMVFGYMEESNEVTLSTLFLESDGQTVFYDIQTQFCESYHRVISEDVDVCYDGLTQYGFNSHRSVNVIIRVEKDINIMVRSDDLDFTFTDDFQEYNYYFASYYGKVRDDLFYYIDEEVIEIK
jgi:hypothetical protein